jgi:hypothetical protein
MISESSLTNLDLQAYWNANLKYEISRDSIQFLRAAARYLIQVTWTLTWWNSVFLVKLIS